MAEKEPRIEKKLFDGSKVKILGETYEPGQQESEQPHEWRSKLDNREKMILYLKSAMRYWYNPQPYGSEKRKKPA